MEIIILYVLAALLCILQIIDLYTTVKILNKGGKELNPVLVWAFTKFGVLPTMIVIKALVISFILFFYREVAMVGLILLDLLYAYVCTNNIKELKKA